MKKGFICKSILISFTILTGQLFQTAPASAIDASSQIQVNVCPAASLSISVGPSDGLRTSAARIPIAGSAKSDLKITILDNGRPYSPLKFSAINRFGTTVPLKLGLNKLVITASNACGQSSSVNLNIYRTRLLPLSPLTWAIIGIVLLIILILLLLWLLLYKRRRQNENTT
jgi:hypothetical protein